MRVSKSNEIHEVFFGAFQRKDYLDLYKAALDYISRLLNGPTLSAWIQALEQLPLESRNDWIDESCEILRGRTADSGETVMQNLKVRLKMCAT
jgi:hypothetical protein